MSTSHRKQYGVFLKSIAVTLAFVAYFVPQSVFAEPLLFLFKNDPQKTTLLPDAIHQKTKHGTTTVGLNKNGDLEVKCGSMNVVVAYNQAEDPLKQPEPVRRAVAMNQDQNAPPISGISISLNFAF